MCWPHSSQSSADLVALVVDEVEEVKGRDGEDRVGSLHDDSGRAAGLAQRSHVAAVAPHSASRCAGHGSPVVCGHASVHMACDAKHAWPHKSPVQETWADRSRRLLRSALRAARQGAKLRRTPHLASSLGAKPAKIDEVATRTRWNGPLAFAMGGNRSRVAKSQRGYYKIGSIRRPRRIGEGDLRYSTPSACALANRTRSETW